MLILGINSTYHDSAAVLLERGQILAALEEERLNRIKHTTAYPTKAVEACMQIVGRSIADIGVLAVNQSQERLAEVLRAQGTWGSVPPEQDAVLFVGETARRRLGLDLPRDRIILVEHHAAHAASAFALSGFSEAVVFSNDGYGDGWSGVLSIARNAERPEVVWRIKREDSIGLLYEQVTKLLGFKRFDEYKVMGLAPYGDATRFRGHFEKHYSLNRDGEFTIDRPGLLCRLMQDCGQTVNEGDVQRDVAAALQETLERLVLHVLSGVCAKSGTPKQLVLAGGVALNCSANGRILYSGMFDDIFVQPAAHDAGGALGAALVASRQLGCRTAERSKHVYLGSHVGTTEEVETVLARWKGFLDYQHCPDICRVAASALAKGAVIGWAQGRSEFGPRALGARSILADPRPAANKDLINDIVKKRESFRPFAPSVLNEDMQTYFETPTEGSDWRFPFMLFVLKVRAEYREVLGATTHVDGTARVQSVDRDTNPRYWQLLHEFKRLTGIGVLLNTSFNNFAEPIVETVEDAIVCLLTTGLQYLAVGDYWVSKRMASQTHVEHLVVSMAPSVTLRIERNESEEVARGQLSFRSECDPVGRRPHEISQTVAEALIKADGERTVAELLDRLCSEPQAREDAVAAMYGLWERRLIVMSPGRGAKR